MTVFLYLLIGLELSGLILVFALPICAHLRPELIHKWIKTKGHHTKSEQWIGIAIGFLFFCGIVGIFRHGTASFFDWLPRSWGSTNEDGEWTSLRQAIGGFLGLAAGIGSILIASKYWEMLERERNLKKDDQ